jgi:TPR repeat protein
MELPSEPPPAAVPAAAARRVAFGLGVREIGLGAAALAVLAAAGVWWRGHNQQLEAEQQALRSEIAIRADAADVYHDRFRALQVEAEQIRVWAESQTTEPLRTWARERARRFAAFVAAVDQEGGARAFALAVRQARDLAQHGDLDAAKALLRDTRGPVFPPPTEFTRLRRALYETPLAEFSRQNPSFYRALRQFEPEAGQRDEQRLRAEITAAGAETVSPQQVLKLDLLAAVAAPDDPLVADWAALASAMDYFESPDGATLARWRRAQHAVRSNDWAGAVAEMQAIAISKVRTRQPFRAVFGRALIKSRPDQPGEAYPYLLEAARAGDKDARLWVAQEEYRQRRFVPAERWLEAAAADGDAAALPLLLELYQKHGDVTEADAGRKIEVLNQVVDAGDPPADAWILLGRLYEQRDPPGSAAKAAACYAKAAGKGSAKANLEMARCAMLGIGAPANLERATDAAAAAFKAGEREGAARWLIEGLRQAPDRTAGAVQRLFGDESIVGGGGYMESHVVDGPLVSQLKAQLARYLDQMGQYGQAARFYAATGDAAAKHRHAELTAVHACATCGGAGKVKESVPCPTCGGKGKQICSFCGGSGFIYAPGTPPCSACGGTGTMMQDRKVVACSTCGGTGKGKGSSIKQDCTHCEHGYIRCAECTNGVIWVTKECPDCHGQGSWSLANREAK